MIDWEPIRELADEVLRLHDEGADVAAFARATPKEVQLLVAQELFNRRELDLLTAILGEDFVQDMSPTGIPGFGVVQGLVAYRRFLHDWFGAFPDAEMTVLEVEAAGDRAIAIIEQRVTGGTSGIAMPFTFANVTYWEGAEPVRSVVDTDLERGRARFRGEVQ